MRSLLDLLVQLPIEISVLSTVQFRPNSPLLPPNQPRICNFKTVLALKRVVVNSAGPINKTPLKKITLLLIPILNMDRFDSQCVLRQHVLIRDVYSYLWLTKDLYRKRTGCFWILFTVIPSGVKCPKLNDDMETKPSAVDDPLLTPVCCARDTKK
jgi:hypothetical protein